MGTIVREELYNYGHENSGTREMGNKRNPIKVIDGLLYGEVILL